MKYTLVFGAREERPLVRASRHAVAAECRVAALELVNAQQKLDAIALARWLAGPYARATRHAFVGDRVDNVGVTSEASSADVADLVACAREEMVGTLVRAAAIGGVLDFAGDAIDAGHVMRARDADGADVWLPVDSARMKLRDRVRSLFVADFTNDPDAYADLVVCSECWSIVFDDVAKEYGLCAAHRRVSGIVFSRGSRDAPVFARAK